MELMELLYRIMEELANNGVPIVFKGAMILNLLIRENNPSLVKRGTRDIDGDWVGEAPSMEQMESALRNAVKNVDSTLDVLISREYGERKSAGFKIVDENEEKIASIDLSVRRNEYAEPYISYINQVTIRGASISKMMSDKLYAVSGMGICRRLKDLLDIYVMSYISEFYTSEICDIWENTGRVPDKFAQFRSEKEEIEKAYMKMKGVINKPEFSELYDRLSIFLLPFLESGGKVPAVWDGMKWNDIISEKYEVKK